MKEETPSKKLHVDMRDKKPPFQRVNTVYTPLTVSITQALMVVEGKGLLARPRRGRRSLRGPLQSRRCYIKAVRKGHKRTSDEAPKGTPSSKRGKDLDPEEVLEGTGTPSKIQPAEELLNIEVIPGNPEKTMQICSQMSEKTKKKLIKCLQRNVDIFVWTPQNLEGIDPRVITHHLNIDPSIKPVKQKKRHFRPDKDKIIQAELDKLMAAGHIEEIQFPEMAIQHGPGTQTWGEVENVH
ncbi:UNVERIFIED_CONTAM: hypothetical protein Slati_2272700 [Sesamum latifolium]|uniref:Reverse transcriptase domain-containing protein n=1 Tax=Sesamum latifolium TaxID=2727402 RepID=A0AAW2WCC5_9LAMI